MSSKITLRSSDGEMFEVEATVAAESQTIKSMIDEGCVDSVIPLFNVKSPILAKVIEYCKKHAEKSDGGGDHLSTWDANFVKVEKSILCELIMAAHFLDIKGLLHLTWQTVADMIRGKTPEEIGQLLYGKNDFTPEVLRKKRKCAERINGRLCSP